MEMQCGDVEVYGCGGVEVMGGEVWKCVGCGGMVWVRHEDKSVDWMWGEEGVVCGYSCGHGGTCR